jgi:hypothetical protein
MLWAKTIYMYSHLLVFHDGWRKLTSETLTRLFCIDLMMSWVIFGLALFASSHCMAQTCSTSPTTCPCFPSLCTTGCYCLRCCYLVLLACSPGPAASCAFYVLLVSEIPENMCSLWLPDLLADLSYRTRRCFLDILGAGKSPA